MLAATRMADKTLGLAAVNGEKRDHLAGARSAYERAMKADSARSVIDHLRHLALARSQLLGDGADELLGDVHHEVLHRLERLALDAQERVLDLAVLDQLGGDIPHGVDRDCEADADVALALAAGLDLCVHADHLPLRIEERPAGVAVIQRGVGLDHMRDRQLVRRLDPSLDSAHDAGGDRPVEPERVPDRDHLVADANSDVDE